MTNLINDICACIGPTFGEPLCSCKMVNQGIERSAEYKEYMAPENIEKRRIITADIMDTILSKESLRGILNDQK
jgi:hypothetical protein